MLGRLKFYALLVLACLTSYATHMANIKFLFSMICISCVLSVVCIQFMNNEEPAVDESLINEALKYASIDSRYAVVYQKTSRLPKNLKYILLWTSQNYFPFYNFGSGQRTFITNNCSVINCYVTSDRNFFGGDTTRFSAIAFNGRNILKMSHKDLPTQRSPQQKYIYFNMESSDNYPVCNGVFDNFFNWTSTYRLDSDIPYPYLQIRNIEGDVVGPKRDMEWPQMQSVEVDDDLVSRLQNKTKAVAWFVSHCQSRSGRKKFAKKLKAALALHKLTVDVYGKCGTLQCPLNRKSECNSMLERDYYFYLSMENSFAEDYVTEKLLTALQHNIVPIVYGGANYTRFLPPGSYLNARNYTPVQLATIIAKLILSPSDYRDFFKWKQYFSYHEPTTVENVCSLCEVLNNNTKFYSQSVYKSFRSWWNPDYVKRCAGKDDNNY